MNIVINKHHRYHFLDIRTRQKAKTEKQPVYNNNNNNQINPTPTQNTHINRHIVKCLRDNIVSYTVFDIMLIKLF